MSGTSDFKIRAPVLQRAPETLGRHGAVERKKAMVDMAQFWEPEINDFRRDRGVITVVTMFSEFWMIISGSISGDSGHRWDPLVGFSEPTHDCR